MNSDIIELTDSRTNEIHKIDRDDVMTFSRGGDQGTQIFVISGINAELQILMVKESWNEVFDKVFK